jgi:hypothetical protein
MTLLLLRNSQTPSEAMTMYLLSFDISYSLISISSNLKLPGSEIQPTDPATKSPIDRLIASPGKFSFLSQTL